MKKILSICLSIVMLLSIVATGVVNASGDIPALDESKPYIKATSEPVKAGEIAKVTFIIGNNPKFWGINQSYKFDTSVLSFVTGETNEYGTFPKYDKGASFPNSLISPINDKGEFTIVYTEIYNDTEIKSNSANGEIFSIYLKVAEDAAPGSYLIEMIDYSSENYLSVSGKPVAFTFNQPKVEVYDPEATTTTTTTTTTTEPTTTTTTVVDNDPSETDPWETTTTTTTEPSSSETEPTEPSSSETEPTQPSSSETEPTEPSSSETEPTQPTSSETEPTEPSSSETTKPSVQPTQSTTEPVEPEDPFEIAGTITGVGVHSVDFKGLSSVYDEESEDFYDVLNSVYYKFNVEEDGWYLISSDCAEKDPLVELYDADGGFVIASDDKFVDNFNFDLHYYFKADETYYLGFSTYYDEDFTTDVTVAKSTEDYDPIWTPEYDYEFDGESELEIAAKDSSDGVEPQLIKFVPEQTGKYTFLLSSLESSIGNFLDDRCVYPDDEYNEEHDTFSYFLEAGKTYYLEIYTLSDTVLSVIKEIEDETPTDIPTEPSETEPSETEPSETEPSETEPSETEPSETEPSETEPSTAPSTEPTQSSTEPTTVPTQSSTEPTANQPSTQDPGANDDFTTNPTVKPDEPTKPTVCVHNIVTKGFKKATYFAKGYTGDKVCIKCEGLVEQGKTTAKLKLKKPNFKVKAVKGKKQFKVTYKKVKGANRFQVRYKIKGKWKVKTFKAKKKVTKLIKKLKAGKYKVQVRAMLKKGKLKAYSKWAKVKRIKVKA